MIRVHFMDNDGNRHFCKEYFEVNAYMIFSDINLAVCT